MREPVFTGACPAIVTPFDATGAINYDRFAQLIDEQIAGGVDAICVLGTTGECATLSLREHISAVNFCVKHVNHRVKVIAGAGSNDTSAAVYLSQHAQDSGADALLHVTPYYNKCSQEGLIRHYEYIADRTELPIILYNVPSRTGVSFTAETYRVLSQNPKINGVKEASGNFSLVAHTRYLCGDDFYIWSGNDDQVVPMMALGAKGVISVVANVAPRLMVDISHLCLDGKFQEAAHRADGRPLCGGQPHPGEGGPEPDGPGRGRPAPAPVRYLSRQPGGPAGRYGAFRPAGSNLLKSGPKASGQRAGRFLVVRGARI